MNHAPPAIGMDEFDDALRRRHPTFHARLHPPLAGAALRAVPGRLRAFYGWHDGGAARLWNEYRFNTFAEAVARKRAFNQQLLRHPLLLLLCLGFAPGLLWSYQVLEGGNGLDGYYVSRLTGRCLYYFNHEFPQRIRTAAGFIAFLAEATGRYDEERGYARFIESEMEIRERFC